MKIAILNVKYSPNLGDGVIADCIEYFLTNQIEHAEVFSLDISGISSYGGSGSIVGGGVGLMTYVKKIPFLLGLVSTYLMPLAIRWKHAKEWKKRLDGCDAVVVGGGQLIMDVDQYFPMRIALALELIHSKVPLVIYAVGVSKKMTSKGLKLFRKCFNDRPLLLTGVRDENSKTLFNSYFKTTNTVVTLDPGLLSSIVYDTGAFTGRHSDVVSFCVTDPSSMKPHSDSGSDPVCSSIDFYIHTIVELAQDYKINLFTNGEDYHYLQMISEVISTLPTEIKSKVTILPRALKPSELVKQISQSGVVVAHRLHANIVAYSHGIPHIGLLWDEKVRSFFQLTTRSNYLVEDETSPEQLNLLIKVLWQKGLIQPYIMRYWIKQKHH